MPGSLCDRLMQRNQQRSITVWSPLCHAQCLENGICFEPLVLSRVPRLTKIWNICVASSVCHRPQFSYQKRGKVRGSGTLTHFKISKTFDMVKSHALFDLKTPF